MNLVIGLGGAGKNTVNQISPGLLVSGVTPIYINTDAEALNTIGNRNRLILDKNNISLSGSYLAPNIKSQLIEIFINAKSCFIVSGLGGYCANVIPSLLQFLIQRVKIIHLITFSPFQFEGDRILKSEAQLKYIAPLFPKLTGYQNIALQTHPSRKRNQPLNQFFENISLDVELYILRSIGGMVL